MFSHCFRNIIDFWIAKRRGRGEKDENLLAARALVFVLDNVYFCGVKTCIMYLVNIQTDTTNFLLKKSIDLAIFSISSAFFSELSP